MRVRSVRRHAVAMLTSALLSSLAPAQTDESVVALIRPDHPRLFFNRETWPEVKARAEGREKEWFQSVKTRIDRRAAEHLADPDLTVRDRGVAAAQAAFVYRVTGERPYLDLARKYLASSVQYYEQCFEQRKSVNWYSTSRVHAIMAWDWLYDNLEPDERRALMERLVDVIHNVITVRPHIHRENLGGYASGFYSVRNCLWFIGATAAGTGIREERVKDWLIGGAAANMKLLAHRRDACGDDGGAASPTLGYAFAAYPWAEQNFLYTWQSATGRTIAPQWPHSGWLANYVEWNWIPGADGQPLEFGYGDTPHTSNRLPISQLYTHMANVRHLFGRSHPRTAALARALQERLPERHRRYAGTWFVYPFLWEDLPAGGSAPAAPSLPYARHFENMGQVFMRSGRTAADTYGLFTCGGILKQHRHYDALNVVIYKHGHQALDTGTRWNQDDNGQHLANYYAQTVAHNCVLIHMPDERAAGYWGGKPAKCNYGGQRDPLGSVVKAFETNDRFTYVAGDATACYASDKCALATRQLVFLMPNRFVIFDRVRSTRPEYGKVWLIHPGSEPSVADGTFRAEHGDGALFCRTLLPRDARYNVVGGPGNEFRTGDVNWALALDPARKGKSLKPEALRMIGQWRLEVAPPADAVDALFLHVIEVGDRSLEAMVGTERVERPGTAGVRFDTDGETCEVTFATQGELAGHIRITGTRGLDRDLTREVQKQSSMGMAVGK
ncbi:MAG: heparinase II/III family protein [Kiritimatiellae bacterium]|nr:heparinase II/III family protein [Kiritimatiellia bacterium]